MTEDDRACLQAAHERARHGGFVLFPDHARALWAERNQLERDKLELLAALETMLEYEEKPGQDPAGINRAKALLAKHKAA